MNARQGRQSSPTTVMSPVFLSAAPAYGPDMDTMMCVPCKATDDQVTPKAAHKRNEDAAPQNSRPARTPRASSGRRSPTSNNRGPNIAAGERPPRENGANDNGGNHPTPQNLRDNPERMAKVKTEMCQYYEKAGPKNCPFGNNCKYYVLHWILFGLPR